ncbi:porin [Fluviibacter phosphoraccumulans]|uniref:porin n=1 Tax=Fluviibacter phosphoraccumulans TaxID=1751046 RepID=UPI0024E1994A|nr:porin [Fluviibacter phosphoraccumulans]
MQKKLIALAVAGLSTAAFAQTNVTIYGVADVSGQGTNMGSGSARADSTTGKITSGGAFNMKSNSSLIGFKGTEDLGNGLKGMFQIETNINLTGQSAGQGVAAGTSNSNFSSLRDSYVGVSSKYGTAMGGYLTTPFRATLTSFDVMPGATGDGRIENLMGKVRMSSQALGQGNSNAIGYVQADNSIRATALAYALPTMYGFNGTIAYTGSNNNGGTNQTALGYTGAQSQVNAAPIQGALGVNLGWEGYGFGIKGAYQQAKVNDFTGTAYSATTQTAIQGYTSYLIGAQYTGVPGLKLAAVYNRNSVGMNSTSSGTLAGGSAKGSNNGIWAGASYRFGNNEPRLSYSNVSNSSGLSNSSYGAQDGATQWTANWGYYLSKRTQVYGIVSTLKNNANANFNMASGGTALNATGGQIITTYGAGLRTNF